MRTNDSRPGRVWTGFIAIALVPLMLGGCSGGGEEEPGIASQIQRYLPYPFGDPEPDEQQTDPAEDAGKRPHGPKGQPTPPPAPRAN